MNRYKNTEKINHQQYAVYLQAFLFLETLYLRSKNPAPGSYYYC